MVMRLRARKEEDKLARREAILGVAARSLGRRQYARVTMAEIAERCGLAKGYAAMDNLAVLCTVALARLALLHAECSARCCTAVLVSIPGTGHRGIHSLARKDTPSRARCVDVIVLLPAA